MVTITSDGGAEFSLTVTKEGELPLTGEGFVDFTGDGIDLDEFPEELLLPDEPPQASGEDVSGVEVAAAITASRIGPDDQQVLLVSAAGGNYQPGDWLEPKDGGNQRMMIVSAGPPTSVAASVLAPRSYSSNGMALAASAPQFYARGGERRSGLQDSGRSRAIHDFRVQCGRDSSTRHGRIRGGRWGIRAVERRVHAVRT